MNIKKDLKGLDTGNNGLVVLLSPTGTIEEASPEIEAVLGYNPRHVRGSLVFRYVYDADLLYVFRRIADLTLGRKDEAKIRFHLRSADGTWMPFKGQARSLLEGGTVAQIVLTLYPVIQSLAG